MIKKDSQRGKWIRDWDKKDKQIVYRCTTSMYNTVDQYCESVGIKKSELLRKALKEYITANNIKNGKEVIPINQMNIFND